MYLCVCLCVYAIGWIEPSFEVVALDRCSRHCTLQRPHYPQLVPVPTSQPPIYTSLATESSTLPLPPHNRFLHPPITLDYITFPNIPGGAKVAVTELAPAFNFDLRLTQVWILVSYALLSWEVFQKTIFVFLKLAPIDIVQVRHSNSLIDSWHTQSEIWPTSARFCVKFYRILFYNGFDPVVDLVPTRTLFSCSSHLLPRPSALLLQLKLCCHHHHHHHHQYPYSASLPSAINIKAI